MAEVGAALHQLADSLAESGGGDAVETVDELVCVGAAGGHGEVPAGGGQQEEGEGEDQAGGEEHGQGEEHCEAADRSHWGEAWLLGEVVLLSVDYDKSTFRRKYCNTDKHKCISKLYIFKAPTDNNMSRYYRSPALSGFPWATKTTSTTSRPATRQP